MGKEKEERKLGVEGGSGRWGVDGTGKMRGKREGETDILETGQAMLGARFC